MPSQEDRAVVLGYLADFRRRAAEEWLMDRHSIERSEAAAMAESIFRAWCAEREAGMRREGELTLDPRIEERMRGGSADGALWRDVLKKGFWLEGRACFIPWLCPRSFLERTPSHEIVGSVFLWKGDRLLGIDVEASTGSMDSTKGLFRLNCKPPGYGFDGDPAEGIQPEMDALSALLGPPDAPEGCSWDLGAVRLTIACHTANEMYFSETWHKYLEFDVL